jgi:hypothetical protein
MQLEQLSTEGNRSKRNLPIILAVRGQFLTECGGDPAQEVPKARHIVSTGRLLIWFPDLRRGEEAALGRG